MPMRSDEAMETLKRAIASLRSLNKAQPSRAKSLAVQHCETALLWLWADMTGAPGLPHATEENAR